MEKSTLAIIISNRSFFPDFLVTDARKSFIDILSRKNINPIILSEKDTNLGAVESYSDAKRCADLFQKHKNKIGGIIISLPNFGDERAIADTIRLSDLNVPILVHAWPDDLDKLSVDYRRDAFCGKLSVCNNLRQYGIKYTLTEKHVTAPFSESFMEEVNDFISTCRVVKGLKKARIGSIGARTTAFKTVRASEKLFEASGISIETADLSMIFSDVSNLSDSDSDVQEKLDVILNSAPQSKNISKEIFLKIAKTAVAIERWVRDNDVDAYTIQCWPTMQKDIGIFPCVAMSLMSDSLLPSACENDIAGAVSMYVLQLASEKPAALFDWNNNYGSEPDKMVLFHCCNCALSMLDKPSISYNKLAATVMGEEKASATYFGRIKQGPFTYLRVSTDDSAGNINACLGQGQVTTDSVETFGGVGVVHIQKLDRLLNYLCSNGYEHHVAITLSNSQKAIKEALTKYMDWKLYCHE